MKYPDGFHPCDSFHFVLTAFHVAAILVMQISENPPIETDAFGSPEATRFAISPACRVPRNRPPIATIPSTPLSLTISTSTGSAPNRSRRHLTPTYGPYRTSRRRIWPALHS